MKTALAASLATLVTASILTGCGGGGGSSSSTSSYCADVKSARTHLSAMGTQFTGSKFTAVNDAVHNLAGEAPAEIKASWTEVATQFDKLQKAVSDAGLSMDDFAKLANGSGTPPNIDPAKLAKLQTTLKTFDTQGVQTATDKIDAQVKKMCHVDLKSQG